MYFRIFIYVIILLMSYKNKITYSSRSTRTGRMAHKLAKEKFPTYDTSAIVPKKSKKGLIAFLIILILVIAAVVGFVFFGSGCSSSVLPAGQTKEVTIENGMSSAQIANTLEENKIVLSKDFINSVNKKDAASKLKPGTYLLDTGQQSDEYVDILVEGSHQVSSKVVVTEGMKLSKIATAVENATNSKITSSEFISAASDASKYKKNYDFLSEVGSNSLEGFLFPKTYSISSGATAEDIVYMMLDQFKQEIATLDFSYPKSKGLDIYQTVKLASIVEKESTSNTMYDVASVFYNRLDSDMELCSDATTAYEVEHDPTPDEVHSNSAYSTYTNKGLPPTPICNPGLEVLKAVCSPNETNYFYFYFAKDKDGNMQYKFSNSYEEHQQAIKDLSN